MTDKISAFVITCDKDQTTLRAVLAAARFADELIVVDKGRSAATKMLARDAAGSVGASYVPVPWSPVVEETRARAVRLTSHDWVVCLDDDEILSPGCASRFRAFVADRARFDPSVLDVPIRHHVLGRFDPAAYYHPEFRPCLFHRDSVEFGETVHAGTRVLGKRLRLACDDEPAYITHLSHPDVETWLEKTNRYTSRPDRSGAPCPPEGQLIPWASEQLLAYIDGARSDDYRSAVALLRGLYDVVDGIKRWEATQPDGRERFREIAQLELELSR